MQIALRKVRVHNLKGVDLTLNPGELIVFTGVSGSGKSSLAFDTIYVEGQRRYIESLSHQVRRALGDLPKPEAESISGIAPTVAIEQKTSGKTPRSTVGTITGIYDFLRVLYARVGVPHCPVSKEPVAAQSREKIIAEVQTFPKEAHLVFLAPYARGKKGQFQEDFAELLAKGFTRLRLDGVFVDLNEEIHLDGKQAHDLDLVIDRIRGKESSRIAEAVTKSLEIGKGFFAVWNADAKEEKVFSQFAHSVQSGLSYGPLEPHDFSFNHPSGMCPTCHGLGISREFDLNKIIDSDRSLAEDCCLIAGSSQTIRWGNIYRNLARLFRFHLHTPWKDLPESAKQVFLYGTEKKWTKMTFVHPQKKNRWVEYVQWKGILEEARERLSTAQSERYQKEMRSLMIDGKCPACKGARIRPYPAEARFGGKTICELTAMPLEEVFHFFQSLDLPPLEAKIGEELLKEIRKRLRFSIDVGLSYLSLDRTAPTLSGGESQRVRLASQVGAGLVGAIYVLDEPSIGLHPIDHQKLIQTLLRLRDQGNTVIVVEHDADTILAADTVVEVGPGAGKEGGQIIAQGPPSALFENPQSPTGRYLAGKLCIETPKRRSLSHPGLVIREARHHNLQAIDVAIPLGGFICVTGVSGSGKSSLISEILAPALANRLHQADLPVGSHRTIEGVEAIGKAISVDQSPIGRTPRSNGATYIKLFDDIRDLFAQLPESKLRGFSKGHFSFNVKEGSCPYCEGLGEVKIDMDFMEDIWTECPQCKGKRFEPEILAVQYKGHSIADVLKSDVRSIFSLFEDLPSIRKKLKLLLDVGLDYLPLGQSATTLSGGEAQRIKLAKELARPEAGKTLYILDEPTTGLHAYDIERLIAVLQTLIDRGHTVLVIEHNLDLIRRADWVLDLGPGAGASGGHLIGQGTPEEIAKLLTPTGKALRGGSGKRSRSKSSNKPTPSSRTSRPISSIEIENASQNNLKSLSLSLPRGAMTVFTGPSGSGKSSLAFETLYAEGQRRYTETLSPYARTLIKQLPKAKFDRIEGLSPAIALEQKTGGLNPRSTVGTMTEVYDFLRILYAHKGVAHDPDTKEKIQRISKEDIVQKVLTFQGNAVYVLAPLSLRGKEEFQALVDRLNREGFLRIRLNGVYFELDHPIPFDKHRKNELYLIIDRLRVSPPSKKRLYEAVEKATQMAEGTLVIAKDAKGEKPEDLFFNLAFAAPSTGKSFPPLTPQTFSFNCESGMCLECQGLGITYGAHWAEEKRVLRSSIRTLLEKFFQGKVSWGGWNRLEEYFQECGIDCDQKLQDLSSEALSLFLKGGPEIARGKRLSLQWRGVETTLAHAVRMGVASIREALLPWMRSAPCSACGGSRLNPFAENVRIEGKSIADLCRLSIEEAYSFLKHLDLQKEPFLQEVHSEICKYLQLLLKLGLGYLSLGRAAPTLSGGELQRIRLVRQLGSGLTSCLYILDEPTIGLHPADNERLNRALKDLRDLGNTLILVEHDPLTIREADYLVDFGPKAGREGGYITAHGPLTKILRSPHSLTGAYLSGRKKIPIPFQRRPCKEGIEIRGAKLHNLKNLFLKIPYQAITCLTGVSGSGKSTLLHHLLKGAAGKAVGPSKKQDPLTYMGTEFFGLSAFEKVIAVDQSPIGQTARADVSTYSEIQPLIRAHFAALPLSRAKGLQGGHFSPNHLRGMCRTCWGLGYKTVDLQFLPAVHTTCPACHGFRLNPISLEVKYKGKHFGEILSMSVKEAFLWFADIPRIAKRLKVLESVGLDYLQLGQEIASLSGGETARLRLSKELAKQESGKTLYLIDEPTVGLHFEDVARLLPIFHALADRKNTLVLIEHNLDVIANADFLIDLGPEAGERGGSIVATGTPEEVSHSKTSKTASYLRQLFTENVV